MREEPNRRTAGNIRTTIVTLAMGATVAGCSPGTIGQADRAANAAQYDAAQYFDQSRQPLPAANVGRGVVLDDNYVGAVVERSQHGARLPINQNITLADNKQLPLSDIARAITRETGIPVVIAPDATAEGSSGGTPAQAQPISNVSNAQVSQTIGRLGLGSSGGGSALTNVRNGRIYADSDTSTTMSMQHNGSLESLLNQVTAHFGDTWQYNGSEIRISRNITRTYQIHALASNLELDSTLTGTGINSSAGGGSSTAGATGTSTQDVKSKIRVTLWEEVFNTIKKKVEGQGSATDSPSTGTVTVTAPPPVIDDIQAFVEQKNKQLSNEITVSFQVLSVQVTNADRNSIDLSSVIKTHGSTIPFGNITGLTGSGGTTATSAGGNTILSSAASAAISSVPGLAIISGGTQAVIQALSTVGKVSVMQQASVTTLNGIPVPFQVTNTRGYLAKQSVTNNGSSTAGTQTTTTLEPGQVTTGFGLTVLPRVDFSDQTVMLQYNVNISALNGAQNGFDTFTSPDGRATIQLPNVNQRNFIQQAAIPTGETLALTGYAETNDTVNKTGSGTPGFYALGGSQVGQQIKTYIVILLTPTVIKTKHTAITSQGF